MNITEEVIEKTARIIAPDEWARHDEGGPRPQESLRAAQGLAEAGLLAAPVVDQEWRAFNEGAHGYAPAKSRDKAERIAAELNGEDEDDGYAGQWVVQSRQVSEWANVPADLHTPL